MPESELPYESAWGWLVISEPRSRARVERRLGDPAAQGGGERPLPRDLESAVAALTANPSGLNLPDLDAWLAGARYPAGPRPAFTKLPFDYRRVPGPIRNMGLGLLDRLASRRPMPAFPEWPAEPRLDEARGRAWAAAASAAGVPLLPPAWPGGARAAVVLTHDLDVAADLGRVEPIRTLEREFGFPSAFGFVPRVSWPELPQVERLAADGCDLYVHDYAHDGRLAFMARSRIEDIFARLFEDSPWARSLMRGFRSGQLLMTPGLLAALESTFDYDLSIPDTERGGPYGGVAGAGTVVPFALGRLMELPLTLPQDFFLEHVMRLSPHEMAVAWQSKLDFVAQHGGVAVANTHPVWVNPSRPGAWRAYKELLEAIANRGDVWVATPSSVVEHLRSLKTGSAPS